MDRRRAEREAKQRRNALIYLWGGAALALLGIVCAIALAPMMVRDSRGVRPITSDQLLALKSPDSLPSPWVSYTPDGPVVETNLGIETRRGTASSKTRFVLAPVKDRWMVVEREMNAHGTKLEGELGKWELGLGPEAMAKIKAQHPDKKDKILPLQLDETKGGPKGRLLFFALGAGAVILLGLGCAVYGFVNRPRPQTRRGG